jgi:hypothetical protein
MKPRLILPLRVDALLLARDKMVVEASADFSRLPFASINRDINGDVPYSCEAIASQPLQNLNLRLPAGVHLHWALPAALCEAEHRPTGPRFPAVPNRWLVARWADGVAPEAWVVESDYLHPETDERRFGCVTHPAEPGSGRHPFRYLGRTVEFARWREGADADAEYLDELTAVGYGDPTFASFYPNCQSVFGFHDPNPPADRAIRYAVLGWYSRPKQDFLAHAHRVIAAEHAGSRKPSSFLRALEARFGWSIHQLDSPASPQTTCCLGVLHVTPEAADPTLPADAGDVDVWVGNTGSEALAACLADAIAPNAPEVEEQLDSILFDPTLQHRRLDFGFKLQEARHERGFRACFGGKLWTLQASPEAEKARIPAAEQARPPSWTNGALQDLNTVQVQLDAAIAELRGLRFRLYADWIKYQMCCYPPPGSDRVYPDADEVRDFIERGTLQQCEHLQITVGKLDGRVARLTAQIRARLRREGAQFTLGDKAAPRCWEPTEPVVLLAGTPMAAPERQQRASDAPLRCLVGSILDLDSIDLAGFERAISVLGDLGGHPFIRYQTSAPCNPLILEWEVEFFPFLDKSNFTPREGDRPYDPDFIESNYEFNDRETDLTLRDERDRNTTIASVYSGRSLLVPSAGSVLQAALDTFLYRALAEEGFWPEGPPPEEDKRAAIGGDLSSIRAWVEARSAPTPEQRFRDPLYSAVLAYERLVELPHMSQSLSGFNDALVMRRRTMQLPIADPVGFPEYAAFAERVAAAVGRDVRSAPIPQSAFTPVRAGDLKIVRLRLVDTFGQIRDVGVAHTRGAQSLPPDPDTGNLRLPPRIPQPARLDFRWMDAGSPDQQSHEHPDSSPICGWVLSNHLDDSLMIYDASGEALGSIAAAEDPERANRCRWDSAPGQTERAHDPSQIRDPSLRRVVEFIVASGPAFLEDFLSTLDLTLEYIEPESFAQRQELALLIGQPLALVRARVSLQLAGVPAIHEGWSALHGDLSRTERQTDAYTAVRIPIRIGEFRQLGDGLVGYWLEESDGSLGQTFYAPQVDLVAESAIDRAPHIEGRHDPILRRSFEDPPQILTMLIDPRGKVHASTGLLPTKALELVPSHVAQALRSLAVTFLSAPVLTPRGSLQLTLPPERGYAWSWSQRIGPAWSNVTGADIARTDTKATFTDQLVIAEGWLRLSPTEPTS